MSDNAKAKEPQTDPRDAELADLRARLAKVEKLADPGGTVVAKTCNVCGKPADDKGKCPDHPGEIVHHVDAKGAIVRSGRAA